MLVIVSVAVTVVLVMPVVVLVIVVVLMVFIQNDVCSKVTPVNSIYLLNVVVKQESLNKT